MSAFWSAFWIAFVVFFVLGKCAPFPCRGRQGFWTLPADVADNLMGWAA